MNEFMVLIPSIDRATTTITYLSMPDDIQWAYCVPDDQFSEYEKVIGSDRVLPYPSTMWHTVANHRQYIMDVCKAGGWKKVIMIDDDLGFLWRDTEMRLHPAEKTYVRQMILTMVANLDEVPMVGIHPRFGNNRVTDDYIELTKCSACVGIDVNIFHQVGCRYNPVPWLLGEDDHVTLTLFNAGYKNRILYNYAFVEKSGAPGGCSHQRDAERQRNSALWLAEHHPEVTIKAKESKNEGWAMDKKAGRNFRVDFIVQWKKAYKPKTRAKNRLF